ncbi:CRP-like cAMP-binding protein [Bradyrhizobium sp. LB1.3]
MPSQRLIARLEAVVGLSEQDRSKLKNMQHTVKTLANREYVLHEGQRSSQCAIVISGFLFRQKIAGTRNQILSIYVSGDMPDVSPISRAAASPLAISKISACAPSACRRVVCPALRS